MTTEDYYGGGLRLAALRFDFRELLLLECSTPRPETTARARSPLPISMRREDSRGWFQSRRTPRWDSPQQNARLKPVELILNLLTRVLRRARINMSPASDRQSAYSSGSSHRRSEASSCNNRLAARLLRHKPSFSPPMSTRVVRDSMFSGEGSNTSPLLL